MKESWDVVILGGGPGGYVAALRGAQLRKRVLLIERDQLGGTCMNYGCIPAKYLLHQTKVFGEVKESEVVEGPVEKLKINCEKLQEEKQKVVALLVKGLDFLLDKNGVEVLKGEASLESARVVIVHTRDGNRKVECGKIILATGSRPAELPFLKPDRKKVITSRKALELETNPRRILIVGAGAVGIELGVLLHRLGSDVTILEILPSILPGWDREIVSRLQKILRTKGIKIHTSMRIEKGTVGDRAVSLEGTCLKDENSFCFEADKVLLAAGRKPNSDFLESSSAGISLDKQGFVQVNSRMETNVPGIFAVGDLTGGALLAHKASHEGLVAAENAAGGNKVMDYSAMPAAVYTEPELASVGLTAEEAFKKGVKTKVGRFPLRANGRALTMKKEEGIVKIVAGEDDRVIGAQMLAPNASEIIAEVSLAITKGLKLHDLASSVHIHPTLSEAVMEASLKANNMALHILNTK